MTDADLRAWLAVRAAGAGPWPHLAWMAGTLAIAAAVVQAWCLAVFFQGWVFDHLSWAQLSPWALGLVAAVAARAGAGWLKDEAGLRASQTVRRQLRRDLVDRVGELGPAWKAGQTSGALTSRLLEQVDGLDAYLGRYLAQQRLVVAGPLVILAAVFSLNWVCGLILLLTAPLIPLFMILIGLGAQAVQSRQLASLNRMSGHFLDVIRGLTSLRLLDAHRRQAEGIAQAADAFRVRTLEVLRLAFLSSTMLEFFSVLAIALTALYLGFTLLGEIDFGLALTFQTALFVLLLAPEFYQPLRDLGTLYHARGEALASAAQLKPVLDAHAPGFRGGTRAPGAGPPALSLQDVSFSYVPGVPVLSHLTLSVRAGERVALTGPSGSGKTTLLRLLLGEVDATAGEVRAEGRPLADWDPDAWRAGIAWLGQHPRLLADSLAENLRVARSDADDDELEAALSFAGLGSWRAALAQGLQTPLGEGGRSVSGGQLRRLGLARLWLRPARLVLLDEPTASLDDQTQDEVLGALDTWTRGKTVVLLSHHPKPLVLADRVIALGGS